MIVVLEGRGALRQGDTYTPIEAGEGIFVPVGEVHGNGQRQRAHPPG